MRDFTMARTSALIVAALCAALLAAVPAFADKPQDVKRVEQAVLELDKAKRSLKAEVAGAQADMARSLAKCKNSGKGWKRIKRVRNRSQRATYRRGARALWSELNRAAMDRAAYETEKPIFDRFLSHFDTPVADPVVQGGVNAHRRRVFYYEAATKFATCGTFEKLTRKVRGFSTDAGGDSRAGDLYGRLSDYVPGRERVAHRKYWTSKDDSALQAARNELKALGGNGGYADYFAFALALRV
jgi:hypothetical protein